MNLDSQRTTSGLEETKRAIVIEGWEIGFQKIEFTKFLRREFGYSLTVGKGITDSVVSGNRVELVVPEYVYERVRGLARQLGAKVISPEQSSGRTPHWQSSLTNN